MVAGPTTTAAGEAACCIPTAQETLDEHTARDSARIFKALADPNRLRLLSIIKNGPADGTCVCDLTEPLQLGQPTVSHHLKILVEAGMLTREKRGTWAYYTLHPQALNQAVNFIHGL